MITLYTWATPNGRKVSIMLEELGVAYQVTPIDIGTGANHTPEFTAVSPRAKIPAITDDEVMQDGAPLAVFESGAILVYLAEKFGQLLPTDPAARASVMGWTFYQAAGVGPLLGQWGHFMRLKSDGPEREYGLKRYREESMTFLRALDVQLREHAYVAGADYSIADIMHYPWLAAVDETVRSETGEDLPGITRWLADVAGRPAVRAGMAVPKTPVSA